MLLDLDRSFEDTALFSGRDFSLAGGADPERVRGEVVTDRYPAVLGITPVVGRAFTFAEAQQPGSPAVAIIGHGLWTRRYGADPGILGRVILVDGSPRMVVGVLPRGFRGLSGRRRPLAAAGRGRAEPADRGAVAFLSARRAAAGRRLRRRCDCAVRLHGPQVEQQTGGSGPAGATAISLYASRADADVRRASFVVLGAVGFVLLIACVNLTNLLAARAMMRRREVAIRVALGAGRARIARQFGIESLLLATARRGGWPRCRRRPPRRRGVAVAGPRRLLQDVDGARRAKDCRRGRPDENRRRHDRPRRHHAALHLRGHPRHGRARGAAAGVPGVRPSAVRDPEDRRQRRRARSPPVRRAVGARRDPDRAGACPADRRRADDQERRATAGDQYRRRARSRLDPAARCVWRSLHRGDARRVLRTARRSRAVHSGRRVDRPRQLRAGLGRMQLDVDLVPADAASRRRSPGGDPVGHARLFSDAGH